MDLIFLFLRSCAAGEAGQHYNCIVVRIFYSYQRGLQAVGTANEELGPGPIWTSELTLDKDTVLVFEDAYQPALVNTDDGN